MSVQEIFATGLVAPETKTPVLLEVRRMLTHQIEQLGKLEPGPDPELNEQLANQVERREQLLERVDQLLAGRHPYGVDQMTPLSG